MFWFLGGIRREIKESSDAATGVADGCKRGVGVDPETHVTGDVPNDSVWECGNKIKEFFFAARVSSVAFTWLEPISVREGRRGVFIARA